MEGLDEEVGLKDLFPNRRYRLGFWVRGFARNVAYGIHEFNPEGVEEPIHTTEALRRYVIEHAQPQTTPAIELVENVTISLQKGR